MSLTDFWLRIIVIDQNMFGYRHHHRWENFFLVAHSHYVLEGKMKKREKNNTLFCCQFIKVLRATFLVHQNKRKCSYTIFKINGPYGNCYFSFVVLLYLLYIHYILHIFAYIWIKIAWGEICNIWIDMIRPVSLDTQNLKFL